MIAKALGIDKQQCRVLLRIWLQLDLRRTRSGLMAVGVRLVFYFLFGLILAVSVVGIPEVFAGATVFLSAVALIVGLEMLTEFHRVVLSAEDSEVLGPQPISSRTYFFARLAHVLVYTGALATALSLPSVLAFTLARGIDLKLGLTAALAAYSLTLFVVLSIASLYASLLRLVGPDRLQRTLGYAQVLLMFVVYAIFLFPSLNPSFRFMDSGGAESPWVYVNPAAWFASWLELSRGRWGVDTGLAGGLALLTLLLLLILARRRLSLAYAQQLTALLSAPSASTPKAEMWRAPWPWPGFLQRSEHRAVALLARAQFKHDHKFRLSVLALLPMTAVFGLIAIRIGGLQDPFVYGLADFDRSFPLYFVVFVTLLALTGQLRESDHYEASWLFRATPCDPAEVILGMKAVILNYFAAPLLILLTGAFALFFDSPWHAILHSAMLFLIMHLLLQLGYFFAPADLPFSLPARSGQSTASQLASALAMLIMIFAVIPLLIEYIYPRGWRLALALAVGGALSWGLERLLRRRLRGALEREV